MTLSDKYTFTIQSPDGDTFPVVPVNDVLTWRGRLDESIGVYVTDLDTGLTFTDDDNGDVFSRIYRWEREQSGVCAPWYITATPICTTSEHIGWRAMFTVRDCKFDVEKCRVDVQPNNIGSWSCVTENWEQPFNIVSTSRGIGAGSPDGPRGPFRATCAPVTDIPSVGVVDPDTGETVFGRDFDTVEQIFQWIADNPGATCVNTDDFALWRFVAVYDDDAQTWDVVLSYIAESWSGPTAPPWTVDENPWVEATPGEWRRKPTVTYNYGTDTIIEANPPNPNTRELLRVTLDGSIDQFYEGWRSITRLLQDVLTDGFSQLCGDGDDAPTLRSHFFGINPGGELTPPTNDAYAFANTYCQEIAMISANDSTYVDVNNGNIPSGVQLDTVVDDFSFREVINDLVNMFNLKFVYVAKTDTWYLEHVTFDTGVRGINLINPENVGDVSGLWVYEYERADVPIAENFEFATQTDNDDDVFGATRNFDGYPIRYSGTCVKRNASTDDRQLRIFFSNYMDMVFESRDAVIKRRDAESTDDVWTFNPYNGTSLFCLVALQNLDAAATSSCLLDAPPGFNVVFGWPCLHESLWRDMRPLNRGVMNEQLQTFTTRRGRIQNDIVLKMCCDDYFSKFNPHDTIRTQLGDGRIVEWTYDEPSERLTINLRHD